jgi:hypothetical protein
MQAYVGGDGIYCDASYVGICSRHGCDKSYRVATAGNA